MPTTANFRNGLCIELEKELYTIISFQHVKPGKGPAFVRTKLKNLSHGGVIQKTFNAGVKITTARVEKRHFQFLYHQADTYYFMDQATFDTFPVPKNIILGVAWLKAGQEVPITFHQEKTHLIACELPPAVHLQVTHTEPAIEGNTATQALKHATVESGTELQVPLFIRTGDLIKVDTRSGKYLDRIQKA